MTVKQIHVEHMHMVCILHVKSCAVGALMRLGGLLKENGYGDMVMVKELQDISLKALQMIYESEEEKHD